MAITQSIKPPPAWTDIEKTLSSTLCWLLAFEDVILNYDTLLVDDVKQALIDQGLLIPNTGFDVDTLIRRNLKNQPGFFGFSSTGNTFGDALEAAIGAEAVILGFSLHYMGNRITTDPNAVASSSGPTRSSQPSAFKASGGGPQWYRFRAKNAGTVQANHPQGLSRGYKGLLDPSIYEWLKFLSWSDNAYTGPNGTVLTQEAIAALIEDLGILGNAPTGEGTDPALVQAKEELNKDITAAQNKRGTALLAPISNLNQNEFFKETFARVAETLQGFIFGVDPLTGNISTFESPSAFALVSSDCIDKNRQDIIDALIDELPDKIKETQRAAKSIVGQALIDRPEELILPTEEPKKRSLTPTDFQCFLLENIAKLSGNHKPQYKYTSIVNTDQQPALTLNRINHPRSQKRGVEELLSLCPEVYGVLVPHLKISRVEYDEFGKIKFGSEKTLEIPNFIDATDVEQITKGDLGRARGAGIKSFTWSLDGVQPAEVDNNISAKLVMYFQTVADFFAGQDQAGKKNPSFLDLVIASPTITKGEGQQPRQAQSKCPVDDELHRQYNGVNFRIKACAGWATPHDLGAMFPHMSDEKINAIEAGLESTRISLYLQQVRHLINFNENGSVELTVEYQASLSGLLTGKTADIFSKSPEMSDSRVEFLTEEVDSLEKRLEDTLDKGRQKATKDEIKAKLEEINNIRETDRLIKYRRFLKRLFENEQVYTLEVPAEELLLPPYADLTPRQRARRAKRRKGQVLTVTSYGSQEAELLKAVGDAAADPANKDAGDLYSQIATQKFDKFESQPPDVIRVPYFYLGDLLDNVLGQIEENQGQKLDFNFFLSEVEMIDPLTALQAKNIEALSACGQLKELEFLDLLRKKDPVTFSELSGIVQLMNIGDIPISLDAFQLWFKNYVIKKDRDSYFFLHFVKDVCFDLITRSLRSSCFGPSLNFEQRFDAQPLTLAADAAVSLRRGKPIHVDTLAAAKAKLTCEESRSVLGLILISTDSRPKALRGDFNKDLNRGIYHNYIGSSCGLPKRFNFNREDQDYLRESRIQKNGALGPEQLRELYSVSIDLVGNNLYKNGNYIYVSPLVLPSTKAQMQLLGLHGYYLVTSVSSTITDRSYDTKITALHEGVKFNESVLIMPQSYGDLPPEEPPPPWESPTQPTTRPAPNPATTPATKATDVVTATTAAEKNTRKNLEGSGLTPEQIDYALANPLA